MDGFFGTFSSKRSFFTWHEVRVGPHVKGLKTTNNPDSFRHYIFAGVEYKDDCPIQKYIPIYLIVAGSFGVFRNLISLCSRGTKRHKKNTGEEVEEDSAVSDFIEHVNIGIKSLIWLV